MADIQVIMEVVGQQDMVKAIKTAERMELEFKKLDKAFNTNKISGQQYSKGVAQIEAKYKTLTKTTDQLTSSTKRFAASQAMAGKRINRMGANLQQVGYQVGDFAVQVQGGTNVMVALGQQGAQLLGIFGAGGALAGAALAIGTALIAPLMKGEKAAKNLTDRIKDLKAEISDLKGEQVIPQEQVDLLQEQAKIQDKLLSLEDQLLTKKASLEEISKKVSKSSMLYGDALAEVNALEEKILKVEEDRAANSKILNEYGGALLEKREELRRQEEESLSREIDLLTTIERFGEDSLVVQRLKKQQAIEIYEEELKRLHLHPSIIKGLLAQKSLALEISNAISNSASEAARLASNLETSMSYGSLSKGEFSGVPSGLDSFGGGGDYRYDLPSTIRPPKVKGKGGGGKGKKDPLAELMKRIELDTKLLDKTIERQEVERAIAKSRDEYSEKAIDYAVAELEAYNKIVDKRRQIDDLFGVAQSTMEDGFMAMVEGTKSVEDAFKDMARQIIAELYRVLVVQQMVGSFSAGGGGILGGAFKMFGGKASGGTVMSNTPYLVGEKGPELIVPQNRGHVMNADLTSKAMGDSGGTVVVNQNFNFQANGDESVKKIIAQAAPSIANMAKQSVIDARRRGGVMKNTFG